MALELQQQFFRDLAAAYVQQRGIPQPTSLNSNLQQNIQLPALGVNGPTLQQFVEETVFYWRARILEIRSKIRKVESSEVRQLQIRSNQDTLLFPPPPPLPRDEIKLGDRVRITLKKRQLKQVLAPHSWNELITQNFGHVGTVVGRYRDGKYDTVVYFPNTGTMWYISDGSALESVSDTCKDDGSTLTASNDLQIGTEVEIDVETRLIQLMQPNHGTDVNQLLQLQDRLGRIITFDSKGDAFVTVSEYSCVIVNKALLSKRKYPINIELPKHAQGFTLGTRVVVSSDLMEVMQAVNALTGKWNYEMTQILGKVGIVTFSVEREVVVKVKDRVWILPPNCIQKERKKKDKRTRHKSGEGHFKTTEQFPFEINQVVQIINDRRILRMLKDLRVSEKYFQVLVCPGMVQGYSSFTTTVVKFNKRSLHVPTNFLFVSNESVAQQHRDHVSAVQAIKVNSNVVLDSSIAHFDMEGLGMELDLGICQAMVGVCKLVAISDETDEAYIRYKDGDVFAIPTEYVTTFGVGTKIIKVEMKDYQKATIEKQENPLLYNQIIPSPSVIDVHDTNKKAQTSIENFFLPKEEDGNVEEEDERDTEATATDEPSDLEQESNDEENHDESANELPTDEIENNEGSQILQTDAGSDTEHSAEEEQVDATFVTQPKQHEIPQVIQPENPTTTSQNSNKVVEQNIPFYQDTEEIILKCALQSTPAANQTVPATPTPNFLRQNSNMVNQVQFTESGTTENRSMILNMSGGTYTNCVIGGDTITVLPQNTNQQQE
uniref:uncharacterized protein LOC100175801 isoform X2 n=1 Tax=Ciona intestinalis TaxID=7719 RepID=UPI00089DBAFC|nr:uncharacterized protein LOC100175801 isoform X2 [Ciona intestinalis]|eukprot:XP_018668024.1 uncharacterized protein LOC100175801 isoform X2 [Ciona intestinalis]